MKHKKTLVAILLCIVLIFSAFALVACGDKGDDNQNNNDSSNSGADDSSNGGEGGATEGILADYSPELLTRFANMLEKTIHYGKNHYQKASVHAMIMDKIMLKSYDTSRGAGYFGQLWLENETGSSFSIDFYDSVENATAAQERLSVEYEEEIFRHKNMLADSEFLEEIMSPSNVIPNDNNIEDGMALLNALIGSNKSITFISSAFLFYNNYKNEISGTFSMVEIKPFIGNCIEQYIYASQSLGDEELDFYLLRPTCDGLERYILSVNELPDDNAVKKIYGDGSYAQIKDGIYRGAFIYKPQLSFVEN